MTRDSYIDPDCPCIEPGYVISRSRIERGLYRGPKELEKYRARVSSKPWPGGSTLDNMKFYARKDTFRFKYNLMMFALEEKLPKFYKALISIGLPEPY